MRRIARPVPRWKDLLLSYYGPICVVLLAVLWITMLQIGFYAADVGEPGGRAFVSKSGPTPTLIFFTALEYDRQGRTHHRQQRRPCSPDHALHQGAHRHRFTAGRQRADVVADVHHSNLHRPAAAKCAGHRAASRLGGTGDAAVLLAAFGPGNDFSHADSQLASIAAESSTVYESHHFYSVLIYFRFRERHYAASGHSACCSCPWRC